jgi:ATP-dependent Lhr-like helicase
MDEFAAENLVRYLEDQSEAAGVVPDDSTVVVERFRDEIGDWRVCVLSPFGSRVHAPWALAIEARLAERIGPGAQVLWSDDGIVIRLPEAEDRIPLDDLVFPPDDVERAVVDALPETALFASVFREASARALLLPRRRPGQRTALWQQRQRSADLLAEAARHPDFPMLLEATRECLRDHFDVPALREVMAELRARRTKLVAVDTDRASPFAQSLLFRWVAIYMYEGDAPLAERRAAALALDRDLLRELLGDEELRELLDPRAIDEVELELQRLTQGRGARNPDDLHDLLFALGDLTKDEVRARTDEEPEPWIARLLDDGRVIRVRIGGEERFAAVEDAARLRDALGVALPKGLPRAFTRETERPLESLVARFARTHGPFLATQASSRFGASAERIRSALESLEASGDLAHGEFRSGRGEREWCDANVLRRLRRRSLALLRKEVEPVDGLLLARFLPLWQGAAKPRAAAGALEDAIARLQGSAIPASVLERDVLPARVLGYRPADLDVLVSSGELVWIGRGPLGSDDGRIALFFRDQIRTLGSAGGAEETPEGPLHDAIRQWLDAHGASFWPDIVLAAGTADERLVLRALWDLVWAGEVTNDTLSPLRALTAGSRRNDSQRTARPRPGALRRSGPPQGAGRWSLVSPLMRPESSSTERAHALAEQLLDRHGVLTREAVLSEATPGGFAGVYPVLKAMEDAGRVRRGYFVAGLGAAQFAVPGAVDRLRTLRAEEDEPRVVVLAAADPAQAYGAALPWPPGPHRPARAAGSFCVIAGGSLAAYLERGARSLLTFGSSPDAWADAVASLAKDGRVRKIELARIDGSAAAESPAADALRAAGFANGYRGLTLRG